MNNSGKGLLCNHEKVRFIEREEVFPVKGESVRIMARVKVCCECGQELLDDEEDANLLKAYALYKERHGLLSSDEIRAIRERYGIGQRTLAALAGCTQASIVRYEKGAVQSEAHNTILSLLAEPEGMRSALERKRAELSVREIKSIEGGLRTDTIENHATEMLTSLFGIEKTKYNGFRLFDIDRFGAMVQQLIRHEGKKLFKTKLMKLLWFSDMAFFRSHVVSISGASYVHQHFGPVPEAYMLLLGLLEREGYIRIAEVETPVAEGEILLVGDNRLPETILSEDETDTIKGVSEKLRAYTSEMVSNLSHMEKGYECTEQNERISYEYAMQLKAV